MEARFSQIPRIYEVTKRWNFCFLLANGTQVHQNDRRKTQGRKQPGGKIRMYVITSFKEFLCL